ncbi:uncharacterized protein LOC141911106 [Tubulanus polymorphus]|uniref:uncharacterized protein LOC141911106 n=1 Tax=Tubulanus polymorphus TaxID=672921 RepID=UPI003DA53808
MRPDRLPSGDDMADAAAETRRGLDGIPDAPDSDSSSSEDERLVGDILRLQKELDDRENEMKRIRSAMNRRKSEQEKWFRDMELKKRMLFHRRQTLIGRRSAKSGRRQPAAGSDVTTERSSVGESSKVQSDEQI